MLKHDLVYNLFQCGNLVNSDHLSGQTMQHDQLLNCKHTRKSSTDYSQTIKSIQFN